MRCIRHQAIGWLLGVREHRDDRTDGRIVWYVADDGHHVVEDSRVA